MNYQERKAVSPVIATVILVAVAITVSIGVSYWMSGISGQYTSFEKIEIQSGYAKAEVAGGWTVTLEMKNSGSAAANLMTVFINDEPVDMYATTFALTEAAVVAGENTGSNIPLTGVAVESGKMADVSGSSIEVYIGSGLFSAGTTINIKVHSAGGMDYIKLIKLP